MKHWSIIAALYCVLTCSTTNAAEVSKLRSPQCVADLMRNQVNMMQHFNGIFGDFIVKDGASTSASMYGPIAAINITSSGFAYNSKSKMNCSSKNRMLRLGLMSKNAQVQGDINGDVWTDSGSIDTKGTENCAFDTPSRIQHPNEDLVQSLFSFAPTTIKKTSAKLSRFSPDTLITSVANGLSSPSAARSFNGYRILKLPACSDRACAATSRVETNPNVLKGGNTWTGQYKNGVLPDEMIVFNIPVYNGGTFTISTLDINKGISPCQAIFNFYAVNQAGAPIDDPGASFTLIRSAGVTIAGTILAPQARIIDSPTGSFGGQLITLQSYEGHGADIKNFDYASNGKCTSQSLCWPIIKAPRIVTAVVTATAKETIISTIKTQNAAPITLAENRAAVPAPSITVTETVVLDLPLDNDIQVFKPVQFHEDDEEDDEEDEEEKDEEEEEDEDEEEQDEDEEEQDEECEQGYNDDETSTEIVEQDTETVVERRIKVVDETLTRTSTLTIFHGHQDTTTVVETRTDFKVSVAFTTEKSMTTIIPSMI